MPRVRSIAFLTLAISCAARIAVAEPGDDEETPKAEFKPTCEPRKVTFGKAASAGTVRVMTYNIRLGASGTAEDDEQPDEASTTFFSPDPHAKHREDLICAHLRQIAEVIATENPDVVGLQEVDQNFSERSAKLYEARELATMLGMHYKFASRKRGYGIALLWRASLAAEARPALELASGKVDSDKAKEVVAYVDFPKLGVRVATTHLSGADLDLRIDAGKTIKAARALATATTILLGDMNTGPHVDPKKPSAYPDLVAGRHDALPDLKIVDDTVASPHEQYDHVFLGAKLTAHDAHIIPTRTLTAHVTPYSHSDHSAVVVNVRR